MKKSTFGKINLLLGLILWMGLGILYIMYHYQMDTTGMFHEIVGGNVLILLFVGSILSLIAWIRNRFSLLSYSFIALLLFAGGAVALFMP